MTQPQQSMIQAAFATYTTAHSNAESLTHWARPGIEPETSWFLVGFVSAAPLWELLKVILTPVSPSSYIPPNQILLFLSLNLSLTLYLVCYSCGLSLTFSCFSVKLWNDPLLEFLVSTVYYFLCHQTHFPKHRSDGATTWLRNILWISISQRIGSRLLKLLSEVPHGLTHFSLTFQPHLLYTSLLFLNSLTSRVLCPQDGHVNSFLSSSFLPSFTYQN